MPAHRNHNESGDWSRLFRVLLIFTSAFALAFGIGTLVRAADLNVLPF